MKATLERGWAARSVQALIVLAAGLSGCAGGGPQLMSAAPAVLQQASVAAQLPAGALAAADTPILAWRDWVREPRLTQWVELALQNNRSLRQQVLAVEKARASYGIQEAALWPTVKATAAGSAQYGVVGVENSTEGMVTRSLDLFLHSPTHVIGEVTLLVRHNLLRLENSLEGIEVVLAHPLALAQCQAWLTKHLPHAERRPVSSNAEGARLATTNPAWSGLASERAATQFGLHIAAHAIQDEAYNRTRFAIICLPQTVGTPPPSGNDCTSLVVSVPNKPGAVHDLLVPLKTHGVSMTRFESRPARTGQWEYYFYIDLQGHPSQPNVTLALQELQRLCAFYKVLGTYPVAD